MSKMIRVDSCGECECIVSFSKLGPPFYCDELMDYKPFNGINQGEQGLISDPSKILPNCQLQNYSQADTRIKEVRKNFIKLQERMICINAEIQELEKSKEGKK